MQKLKSKKEALTSLSPFEQGLVARDSVEDIVAHIETMCLRSPRLSSWDGYRLGVIATELPAYQDHLKNSYFNEQDQEFFSRVTEYIGKYPEIFTRELSQVSALRDDHPLWAQSYGQRVMFILPFLDTVGRVRVKQGTLALISSRQIGSDDTVSVKIEGMIITVNKVPYINLDPIDK